MLSHLPSINPYIRDSVNPSLRESVFPYIRRSVRRACPHVRSIIISSRSQELRPCIISLLIHHDKALEVIVLSLDGPFQRHTPVL